VLEAAEFAFPTPSLNLFAATEMLGVPSLVAVQVAVYVAPEPESDPSEHPDAVMSFATKSVVDSLLVKVSAMAAVFVVAPLDTVLEVMVIVGAVLSYVHV
tara:strand:- start:367 stop:666 length:300 start_codon:yes stop_codon:yes gene_type:complete